MIFFGIIFLILIGYFVGRDIYWKFDHGKWSESAKPDINATIIDVSSKKVHYAKNETKYQTTVIFSDGFVFTTTKTNREENFFTYTISIDKELLSKIVELATKSHRKAIEKIMNSR